MTALHMKYKTTTAEKEKKRKETDKQRKKNESYMVKWGRRLFDRLKPYSKPRSPNVVGIAALGV